MTVRRKLVDTTYFATSVPPTHKRKFSVAEGVRVEVPGKLPELWRSADGIPSHVVILGAGKTVMDAGVWLLEAGFSPDRITWVKPRESWLINRRITQPGQEFFEGTVSGQIALMKAAGTAESVHALFQQLEEVGAMLRIDQQVEPEMFHYATISEGEVERLRTIGNVVRKGRVEAIEPGRMMLAGGEAEVPDDTLFVDCTASAVTPKPVSPQWEDGKITLQLLHVPLVTLNAAVTAFIEANFDSDEEKNALCKPVSFVDDIDGYAGTVLGTGMNRYLWASNPKVSAFLAQSRLDPAAPTVRWLKANAPERLAIAAEMPAVTMAAIPNLQKLVAEAAARRG